MARCTCDREPVPSSNHEMLAFFEFRGEGSPHALNTCGHCGYNKVAHGEDAPKWADGRTAVERANCPGFEPAGAAEFDTYYCGHSGWD